MTVYLDVVFVLNSAICCLLLLAGGRLGGGRLTAWRLALSSVLGGAYNVLALFPNLGFLNCFASKIVLSVLMVILAFGVGAKTVRLVLLFWVLSFCFAGAVFVAAKLFRSDLLLIGGGVFYPVSAFGLMLVAAAGYLLAHLCFSGLCLHTEKQIVPLTLTAGQKSVRLRALVDTGNTLRDPLTNEAVTVAEWQTLSELLPELHLRQEEFLAPTALISKLSAFAPKLKVRLIPYKAVGVETGFLLAAKLKEENKNRHVLIAFSPNTVSDGGNYDALTGEIV